MIIKKYLVRFFVLISVLLSVLIPCEFGIRTMYPKYDPSGRIKFDYNEQFNIRIGKKNYSGRQIKNTGDYDTYVEFNKYGFRDKKDIADIKSGELAVVGDSFSLGWGVDEDKRYSDKLQKLINRPVYNISISNNLNGYSQLLNYAESAGANIKNVILGLCMENDLLDYEILNQQMIENDSDINRISYSGIKNYLSSFALFNLFTTYVHSSPKLKTYAVKYGLIIDNLEGIPKNEIDENVLDSSVNILNDLNKKYNLLVVIIPSRGLWVGKNKQIESKVHNKLISTLNDMGIDYIDLRKALEQGGKPLLNHFKNDGHWNEKGHSLAAKKNLWIFDEV